MIRTSKPEVAVDARTRRRGVRLDVGAELQRVRRDGEVAVRADARIVAVADADATCAAAAGRPGRRC